jgi:hypothetical protein
MDFSKINRYLPVMIPALTPDNQHRDYSLICKRVALCASAIFAVVFLAGQTLPLAIVVAVTTATLHTFAEIFRAKVTQTEAQPNPEHLQELRQISEQIEADFPEAVVLEEQPNPEHMQELRLISEAVKGDLHTSKPKRRRRRKKQAPKKPTPQKIEPSPPFDYAKRVYARGLYMNRGMNLLRQRQLHPSVPR